MRQTILRGMVALLAAFVSASAWAQGTFPLTYQEPIPGPDAALSFVSVWVKAVPAKPQPVKTLPSGATGKLAFFSDPAALSGLVLALDASTPPRLFVDSARSGDMSKAKPFVAQPVSGAKADLTAQSYRYGPVTVSGAQPGTTISFYVEARGAKVASLGLAPAGYCAGEVRIADRPTRVALVDANLNGSYADDLASQKKIPGGRPDVIAIDLNRNGAFDEGASREIQPLMTTIQIEGQYYALEVSPNGRSVKMEKATPKTGTLDLGTSASGLELLGDAGYVRMPAAPDGRWQLPVGSYMFMSLELERKDAKGAAWTLRTTLGEGKLRELDIRENETLAVKSGPPLLLRADLQPADDGIVTVGLNVIGQAGEKYAAGASKDGEQQAGPTFKILDAKGKEIEAGQFEYG